MKLTLTDDNDRVRHVWDTDDIDVFAAIAKACSSHVIKLILRDAVHEAIKKAEGES